MGVHSGFCGRCGGPKAPQIKCKPCDRDRAAIWYQEHKDHALAAAAVRRRENRELLASRKAAWAARNPDKVRAAHVRFMAVNRDKAYATLHAYRARRRGAVGAFTAEEWQAIVKRQNGKCLHCREKKKLEKDHIMPLNRGGCNFAFNIQGLCKKCNLKKTDKILEGVHYSLFDRMT